MLSGVSDGTIFSTCSSIVGNGMNVPHRYICVHCALDRPFHFCCFLLTYLLLTHMLPTRLQHNCTNGVAHTFSGGRIVLLHALRRRCGYGSGPVCRMLVCRFVCVRASLPIECQSPDFDNLVCAMLLPTEPVIYV